MATRKKSGKTPREGSKTRGSQRRERGARLHPITFCTSCGESIPEKAITCYHCGEKQSKAQPVHQVVFCEHCGEDFPARAMTCYHCGHRNVRHPSVSGQISG